MSEFFTLPVVQFLVCEEDEDWGIFHPDGRGFENAEKLLEKLRAEYPDASFTLVAEIDA
jgi:hypothetical protein